MDRGHRTQASALPDLVIQRVNPLAHLPACACVTTRHCLLLQLKNAKEVHMDQMSDQNCFKLKINHL